MDGVERSWGGWLQTTEGEETSGGASAHRPEASQCISRRRAAEVTE
jgi:hypothetical protein